MSVLDVPATQYHADQLGTEQPSLSASIAKILLAESPAHAKARHPRLSDFPIVRESKDHLELGEVVHAILLDGSAPMVDVFDYKDWRTKEAREARDASLTAGRIPMKRNQWENALTVAESVKEELRHIGITPRPLSNGKPEQTLTWKEGDVFCRSRIDWLHNDHLTIDDLKTTSQSANPFGIDRTINSMGYEVSAAFYRRGLKAVTGKDATFRWIFVETTAPFAVSVVSLAPDWLTLAEAKVERAIEIWRECLATNKWPSYPSRVCYVEAPGWAESSWLERIAVAA